MRRVVVCAFSRLIPERLAGRLAGLMLGLVVTASPAPGQSLDDLNIQIHGYATQGLLYTTQNNILTTDSSDGSPAWTEAVLNIGAQPLPKLRVAVQGRYFLLGNFGGYLSLDWAAADYRANDRFGVRFGKVKTPSGLFNETQDIDPSYMWALLPQSVYPITTRNSVLAHNGGVAYGTVKLGAMGGKLEYRGWGGERTIRSDDGFFLPFAEAGLVLPNGSAGIVSGGALHWLTPLSGWMVGASDTRTRSLPSVVTAGNGALRGTEQTETFNAPSLFTRYEKKRLVAAGEYVRYPLTLTTTLPGIPASVVHVDARGWYAMASYKVTEKLAAGVYDSEYTDHQMAWGPGRYQKDWAVSARYDFNPFLYAKAEEHFLDGTGIDYDVDSNPHGLKPDTKLTILKIGVSF